MKTKDGGPAFPKQNTTYKDGLTQADNVLVGADGLSKLEWFAGMALTGELSGAGDRDVGGYSSIEALAVGCFTIAQAMLAESERRSGE